MNQTKIQWTDSTWNPIRGCSRVSQGCMNCYAEKVAHRFNGLGQPYEGLTTKGKWNGTIKVVEDHLLDPLRWQKPRKVFVNSMSDLFHENVSDETIDRIFAVTALAPQHTFQVLTKRPERMREYITSRTDVPLPWRAAIARTQQNGEAIPMQFAAPNVWLGVSVENQETADERIPLLLQTPAAVRFVSAEPLLGLVDFTGIDDGLDWVIVGGESGPGARPCDVQWVRSVVQQCHDAGVACFVKQLGGVPVGTSEDIPQRKSVSRSNRPMIGFIDRKGGDMAEWPEDLRVREFPA